MITTRRVLVVIIEHGNRRINYVILLILRSYPFVNVEGEYGLLKYGLDKRYSS